jgi:hypothetical protein
MVFVGAFLSLYISIKYGFRYPHNKYTNRLSIKKLKVLIRSGKIENDALVKALKVLVIVYNTAIILILTALTMFICFILFLASC